MYNKSYIEVIMDKRHGKYAWTATIGEKGQIVIPKQARELFSLKPGDSVLILGDLKRGLAIPKRESFAEIFLKAFAEEEDKDV